MTNTEFAQLCNDLRVAANTWFSKELILKLEQLIEEARKARSK